MSPREPLPEGVADGIARVADAMKVDVLLYNGPISEDGLGSLIVTTTKNKQMDHLLLILVTYGGDGNSGYRIGRFLQGVYDKITVYVPSYCKSAGTLIAISANKIIMSDFAELGPLDVQLSKRDELWEMRSGLVTKSALSSLSEESHDLFAHLMLNIKAQSRGLITFRLASQLASEMTTSLMAPIFSQINPSSLGEDFRDLMLGYEYGIRLVRSSRIAPEHIVRKLVHDYPSHDFVIDKAEARELFGDSVGDPSADLYSVTAVLRELAFSPNARNAYVRSLTEKSDETTGGTEDDNSKGTPPQEADGGSDAVSEPAVVEAAADSDR